MNTTKDLNYECFVSSQNGDVLIFGVLGSMGRARVYWVVSRHDNAIIKGNLLCVKGFQKDCHLSLKQFI